MSMGESVLSYRGASFEFVFEVGALTIGAATLEEAIYVLAEELACDNDTIRSMAASRAADRIIEKLKAEKLPPWTGADVDEAALQKWLLASKGALGERGQIVHSWGAMQRPDGGEMKLVRREQKSRSRPTTTDPKRVRALRERIDGLVKSSYDLTVGVMPLVIPGIYLSYCGGRGITTVWDPSFGYATISPLARREQRVERIRDFWTQFMASGGGFVLQVDSPAGRRDVPPWFHEAP